MLNIAICDDEKKELEIIYSLVSKNLTDIDQQFKINYFDEGEDLIEHMDSFKELYDIIFLDIYMKFSNGIDIAKRIREFDKECKIIFITSSKEHAIDSYDVKALHYILKPINEEKLFNAIKTAIDSLKKERKEIVITNKKGTYRVIYNEILHAESKARLVNIYLKSGKIITFYSKLQDFFESLEDERFLKSHKSFIVNMDYITKIENASITIINDKKIPISNSNIQAIKEVYYRYLLK
ncbi:LytR/AlgR family response regulator transcription factor [Clostridium grantii]|uniref:Stage 0 sporulation protein A homolog n=1 Tax=Clostridium grantii DSM 8605 TaxID=1121316 RepID=A0A1M5VCD5_9CLOT|nr:LytTR family DNA-binding domain-containing protein [Clostridium grantii]SHH72875.1 two component transcriptional regulator, LytTR family [Clostridium grantii DSM 8605]